MTITQVHLRPGPCKCPNLEVLQVYPLWPLLQALNHSLELPDGFMLIQWHTAFCPAPARCLPIHHHCHSPPFFLSVGAFHHHFFVNVRHSPPRLSPPVLVVLHQCQCPPFTTIFLSTYAIHHHCLTPPLLFTTTALHHHCLSPPLPFTTNGVRGLTGLMIVLSPNH